MSSCFWRPRNATSETEAGQPEAEDLQEKFYADLSSKVSPNNILIAQVPPPRVAATGLVIYIIDKPKWRSLPTVNLLSEVGL